MKRNFVPMLALGAVLAVPAVRAQQQHLDSEPFHNSGESVTPAFEGWFHNPDGSFEMMVGFYNRNLRQDIDVPIGPNNHIDPGGPDYGQPTHFFAGRGWGPFTIHVPKDFGTKELTWTINANGKPMTVPLNLKTDWEISPYIDATNNTPPWLSFQSFDENGPKIQGQLPLVTKKTAKVGTPLSIDVWVADDNVLSPGRLAPKNPITLRWNQFRGPEGAGPVKFSNQRPPVEEVKGTKNMPPKALFVGKSTTTVTFADPGEYTLYLAVNDASGEGGGAGFQCCWTNGHVKVTVTK